MPVWIICCPTCGSRVENGLCSACGVQVFAPLPRWQRVLLASVSLLVLAIHCAAVPFYLAFALFLALRQLWLSRERGGIHR